MRLALGMDLHLVHKLLIRKLPDKVLKDLLADCALIADEIYYLGHSDEPVHKTTLIVLKYPISHFCSYCRIVIGELIERGIPYQLDIDTISILSSGQPIIQVADIFDGWHNTFVLKYDYYYFMYHDDTLTDLEKMQLEKDIEQIFYTIC